MRRPGLEAELEQGTVVGWGRNGSLDQALDLFTRRRNVVSTPNQQSLEMPALSTEKCVAKYQTLYQVDLTGKS